MGGGGISSRGRIGFCSLGGLGLDSMICEKRTDGEGGCVGEGPAGRDDPMRRPARMVPIVDAMSVYIACLVEIWCELAQSELTNRQGHPTLALGTRNVKAE